MSKHKENLKAQSVGSVSISSQSGLHEGAEAHGRYSVECFDKDGNLKWSEEFDNVVTTVGKNLALDSFLAGSGYTVVGPYLGLINGSAASAVVGDTMASHAAWLEVGLANAPTYTGSRKTVAWSAASGGSKAASAAASFVIGSPGTVGGCFLALGAGASATIDNTGGTLYSAGAFTGGSRTVAAGDTLNVSYSASL